MELPPPAPEMETSASDVLTNGDLLHKILLCLGCRSCLVRAALTSKPWLRAASRILIPDFCRCHLPRLLGVYISSEGISGSEFIPLLQSDVLNHADFSFGNLPASNVWDCRNGFVLFEFGEKIIHHVVRSPLLYPNMDNVMALPPVPQPSSFSEHPHAMLLPADHNDDALCYHVNLRNRVSDNQVTALVFALRSGSWGTDCIATSSLPNPPPAGQILPTTVLIGGKIYMATQAGYILGLNLSERTFFTVDRPEGMELDQYPGNLVHCRGDDSVLYLIHVDAENNLNVWLRNTNNDGHSGAGAIAAGSANGWVLRDTISICETCGHLMEQGWEMAGDGDEDAAAVMVVGAGDNAEFVFLELGITGVVMYMHLKTKEVKQVYQREPYDDFLISVRPFMFVGPTVFPVQEDPQEDEAVVQE